jgi:hypothetical protein
VFLKLGVSRVILQDIVGWALKSCPWIDPDLSPIVLNMEGDDAHKIEIMQSCEMYMRFGCGLQLAIADR